MTRMASPLTIIWFGGKARLLKPGSSNGAIMAECALEQDVWFISLAKLPASAIPQGAIQPEPCESR